MERSIDQYDNEGYPSVLKCMKGASGRRFAFNIKNATICDYFRDRRDRRDMLDDGDTGSSWATGDLIGPNHSGIK